MRSARAITSSTTKRSSGVRFSRACRAMAAWSRGRRAASASFASATSRSSREYETVARRRSGSTATWVTVTSSMRSSSMRSSSSARISRHSSFTRAVRA
jgi:hypothetical protein